MTRQYCDRCGKEIAELKGFFVDVSEPLFETKLEHFDLCPACQKDLAMFLKGSKVVSPPYDPIFGR